MTPQALPTEFRLYLQQEFLRRCRKNPRYSIRSYAKTLQVDFSTLAKMLKASRPIGPLTIRKLGSRLGLSSDQIARFLQERGSARKARRDRGSEASPSRDYQQLALDAFQIVADWYHYAILELMRLDGFKPDPRWIASRLGISASEVTLAADRLQRAGLIEITPERWRDLSSGFTTTLGGPDTAAAFRQLQRQILEKALVALEEVPVAHRDQTSMTFAADSRKLAQARELTKKYRRELNALMSSGTRRDSVYHLSVSLYPVTPIPPSEGEVR